MPSSEGINPGGARAWGQHRIVAGGGVCGPLCGLTVATAGAQTSRPPPPPAAPVRWTLGDVVAAAIANNPMVGQSDAEVRAAAARRGQAASAAAPGRRERGLSWTEAKSDRERRAGAVHRVQRAGHRRATGDRLRPHRGDGGPGRGPGRGRGAGARWSRVEIAFNAGVAYFNVLRAANLQRSAARRCFSASSCSGRRRPSSTPASRRGSTSSAPRPTSTRPAPTLPAPSTRCNRAPDPAQQYGARRPRRLRARRGPRGGRGGRDIEDWLREADEEAPGPRGAPSAAGGSAQRPPGRGSRP